MQYSRRFKKAWTRCNQRLHDKILSRPPMRYVQRWPDPALERCLPVPVPSAALRARATQRTLTLAQPFQKHLEPPPRVPGAVEPAALTYEPSIRIMELARPAISKRIQPSPSHTPRKKKEVKPIDPERLARLATKKPSHRPEEEKKSPGRSLKELLPNIQRLCQPPKRFQSPELAKTPHSKMVTLEALRKKYEPSDRIKALAIPKQVPDEFKRDLEFDPYFIRPEVLAYKATDNINKLAEPRMRTEKKLKKG